MRTPTCGCDSAAVAAAVATAAAAAVRRETAAIFGIHKIENKNQKK